MYVKREWVRATDYLESKGEIPFREIVKVEGYKVGKVRSNRRNNLNNRVPFRDPIIKTGECVAR